MGQFTFILSPRSFIQTERLLKQEKIRKVKASFCLVAMLPDEFFLKGTFGLCHSPLRWQLLQLSEVFHELCFDRLIRLHILLLVAHHAGVDSLLFTSRMTTQVSCRLRDAPKQILFWKALVFCRLLQCDVRRVLSWSGYIFSSCCT